MTVCSILCINIESSNIQHVFQIPSHPLAKNQVTWQYPKVTLPLETYMWPFVGVGCGHTPMYHQHAPPMIQ